MPTKPKTTQPETPNDVQERDVMLTPNYATDLIAPFIPTEKVWDSCAGDGMISNRLRNYWKLDVFETEINGRYEYHNFVTDVWHGDLKNTSVVINCPFSLKEKFFRKLLNYDIQFAMLIPMDYSSWVIEALDKWGCEKLIPNRRISYITPNITKLVHYGEVWKKVKNKYSAYKTYKEFKKDHRVLWDDILSENKDVHNYENYKLVPNNLLAKYSASQFHSGFLTKGFGFGKSETFVNLSIDEIKNNIV